MTALNEFQALTQAIGEYSVDCLGKENLSGLQVVVNPRESTGFVTIALSDQSDEAQRRAITEMFEVERLYADEVTLTFVFVEQIDETMAAASSVPQYSYV